jgi:hypothetical protein
MSSPAMTAEVAIPVIVTQDTRAYVIGLDRTAFMVRVKSTILPISGFLEPGGPASIVFVVDMSNSIEPADLARARRTVDTVVARTGAGSQYAVVGVAGTVFVSGWQTSAAMSDAMNVLEGIRQTRQTAGTSLHEGIRRSLQVVATASFPKRAVIIISDGQDTRSSASATADMEQAIRRTPALMYALVMRPRSRFDFPATASGDGTLMKRIEMTGGRPFQVGTETQWTAATDSIIADLEHYYLLTVTLPPTANDDHWHQVDVSVVGTTSKVTTRRRTGYMRSPRDGPSR